MATVDCEHLRIGREYLESVSWPSALRKPARDRCYCNQCYPSTLSDTLNVAGYTYVLPRGWTRFAVSVDEAFAEHHNIWDSWLNCYHGTSIECAKSAVEHRQLLLPSDVTLEGTKLTIREGHIPGEDYVFTTPSIAYAALPHYAFTYDFPSSHNSQLYKIKVALQCKQKPASIIVQPETVNGRQRQERLCPYIPNEKLEWKTQNRSAVMIYGILLEIKNLSGENEDLDESEERPASPTEDTTSEPIPSPRGSPAPSEPTVDIIRRPVIPLMTTEGVDRRGMTKKRIAMLLVLPALSLLPLAALIIGLMYSADCPIQPWIPRWLLICGAVGLGIMGLMFLVSLIAFKCCSDRSHIGRKIGGCILGFLVFFFLASSIAGSVWVFPARVKVQFGQPNTENYCREILFMFAFGLLLAQYGLGGLFVCTGCIGILCARSRR